jgi:DNA modification methylase
MRKKYKEKIMLDINKIYLGDCLEVMKDIEDGSIDMILCDLPYGTTNCKWDIVIPFDEIWEIYNRIIKDNGCIALFGTEPFSSILRVSNLKWYKYDWIWEKDKATNHLNCRKQPMRKTELISIFYKKQVYYNPIIINKNIKNIRPLKNKETQSELFNNQSRLTPRSIPNDKSYPNNILKYNGLSGIKNKLHPTQKPVPLLEYLIKTYTNEGELLLDNCIGSGSTCIAAINTNRKFIGIEKEEKYFNIAKERINNHIKEV